MYQASMEFADATCTLSVDKTLDVAFVFAGSGPSWFTPLPLRHSHKHFFCRRSCLSLLAATIRSCRTAGFSMMVQFVVSRCHGLLAASPFMFCISCVSVSLDPP